MFIRRKIIDRYDSINIQWPINMRKQSRGISFILERGQDTRCIDQ